MAVTDWLEEITPDRREVSVCLDRRLVSDLVMAKQELDAIDDGAKTLAKAPRAQELERKVTDLEDAVRSKSRTFVFEGLGWGRWRDLISKHPPSDEQASVFAQAVQLGFMPHAVENIGYNAGTLVPAAISASCIEPGISDHEASTLLRKAPPGVIERIWTAVLEVNIAGGNDPFVGPALAGNSDGARPSAKRSRRRSPSASPDPSSSAA
jgi:hypothetical protein